MSIPARSTAATIWRIARSTSRVQHPARLGRPGAGRHARVDHVDVDRQVDAVRSVEGLGDRVGDDGLGAAFLDLAHEVPAQALLPHPLERLGRRPVAAQPDLDEVLPLTAPDSIRRRIGVPWLASTPQAVVGGVGVGVEMDDPDAARPARPRRRRSPPAR